MPTSAVIPIDSDARLSPRTNMFIAAMLHAADGASAVRLRNMSPTGALAEGAVIPEAGTPVQLIRGGLRVAGSIAWCEGTRCGIRFASAVVVREWMSSGAHSGQAGVDQVVRQYRAGSPFPAPASAVIDASTAEDFARLRRLIDMLSEALSSDLAVLTRHGSSLQNLDIAGQLVAALAAAADPDPGVQATALARLQSLRASADHATALLSRS